jgi:hypothetical protein
MPPPAPRAPRGPACSIPPTTPGSSTMPLARSGHRRLQRTAGHATGPAPAPAP